MKNKLDRNEGATIFSDVFDMGRRSWLLKIDIDKENNISIWLVEKGAPLN